MMLLLPKRLPLLWLTLYRDVILPIARNICTAIFKWDCHHFLFQNFDLHTTTIGLSGLLSIPDWDLRFRLDSLPESSPLVLDIDLSFFCPRNPYRDVFTADQYRRLKSVFSFMFPLPSGRNPLLSKRRANNAMAMWYDRVRKTSRRLKVGVWRWKCGYEMIYTQR